MNKKNQILIILFLNLVLLSQSLHAQSQWAAQTSGTTKDLYGCYFFDAQTGWIVGAGGTILKTTNGGNTWSSVSTTITSALYAVFFYDASNGWICGYAGKILRTSDGGATWSPQSLGIISSGILKDVFFTSASTGYIAGTYGVYKTTDGGSTWTLSHTSNSSQINAVRFKDAANGWSVGLNGKIRVTSDGGASWTQVNTSSSDDYYDMCFAGNKTFVVGFKAEVLSSTNNGSSFSSLSTVSDIHAIRFLDNNTGWFCGSSGKIYFSNDAGNTWIQSNSGSSKLLKDVFFISANTGWCIGYGGTILKYQGSQVTAIANLNKKSKKQYVYLTENEIVREADENSTPYKVSIYSSSGMLLLQNELSTETSGMSINALSNGMYVYVVEVENETVEVRKFFRSTL